MRHKILVIVILMIIIIMPPTSCFSQDIKDKLDTFFTTLYKQYHLNGCVLVADKGEILYKNAFGYSNFIAMTKLTANSMFDLGSITKQFTAAGIMILREQELLEYSTNIRTFFPQLPYDSITIRHLLNHTSGLVDLDDFINRYWDKTKIITNEDFLNLLIEHQPPLAFRPGTEYQYCNTGFILLAMIIEKVSGMDYGEFLRRNIFAPAGMTRTMNYRRRYRPEAIDDYAFGYVLSLKHGGYALPDSVEQHKRVIYSGGLQGAGTISSTVEDLFRWDRCLYTNKIVPQHALQKAFTPGKLTDGTVIDIGFRGHSYGFGWRIYDSEDGKMVWHTGHYPGISTLILRYIDIDRTIICLSNNGFEWYLIMETINDILNDEPITLPLPDFAKELRLMFINNEIESLRDSIMTMVNRREQYYISEWIINDLGYDLLNLDRLHDALLVFDCNTQLFPNSSNAYDSQGEAFMLLGEYDKATRYYERSLELDSNNTNALEMLKKINKE